MYISKFHLTCMHTEQDGTESHPKTQNGTEQKTGRMERNHSEVRHGTERNGITPRCVLPKHLTALAPWQPSPTCSRRSGSAQLTDMYMKAEQEVCKALIDHMCRPIVPAPPLVLGIYNSNVGTPIPPVFCVFANLNVDTPVPLYRCIGRFSPHILIPLPCFFVCICKFECRHTHPPHFCV